MADMMNFPKRWEDFLHNYEFEDSRRVYTNGSRLIQSFRVEQMMEHYALRPVSRERVDRMRGEWKLIGAGKNGRGGIWNCTRCEKSYPYKCDFCPACGAPMTDEAVEMVMERINEMEGTENGFG